MQKLSFCKKNASETKKLYKTLKSIYKGVNIKRKDCLGKCKTCKKEPFAQLDGKTIACDSVEDLYDYINRRILKEWKESLR
ncbi:DUF1450 domain-containing protein [Ammoniphilus sp. CFH 90114]|uniref:DUF1450 domain-containing protein n=1 Tax=Ammoniphilus sp. CFH 90114 TaxID=2493665 RepID=UPI00100F586F|nr:DUF1450 domain-containing protein [Ammoniphilus sp. CFH 90114]RXT07976.1 DUF1450 domain-containing protein [Ammoniphilus sp. CFH 90114]